jgi:hypothetical protein
MRGASEHAGFPLTSTIGKHWGVVLQRQADKALHLE